MQGNIDFSGTLKGSIAGGGSGGSEVTITPTLQSGTKIADYTIDETRGSLYAPTPVTLPGTIVTEALRKYNDDTQTKIMTVTTLDASNNQEVSQDIYAPAPVQCWYTPGLEQDYQIGQFTYGSVTQNVYIPYFQRPLTAGTGISIDSTTDTISCTASGGINYSTSEQDTGVLWLDGKHIFRKTFRKTINIPSINRTWTTVLSTSDLSSLNIDTYLGLIKGIVLQNNVVINTIPYSSCVATTGGLLDTLYENGEINMVSYNITTGDIDVIMCIEYTKTS